LKVGDHLKGRSIKCPRCAKILAVPATANGIAAAGPPPLPPAVPLRSAADSNIKDAPGVRSGHFKGVVPEDDNLKAAPDMGNLLEESTVPPELKARVEEELTTGERLLWIGQPDQHMILVRALGPGLGAVFIALVLGSFFLTSAFRDLREHHGTIALLIPLIVLPIILGIGIVTPFFQKWRARRTCYVLTNRRAIVWQANWFGIPRMTNYNPAELTGLRRADSWFVKDCGDVIFKSITVITTTTYRGARTGRYMGSSVSKKTYNYGFLAVRNPRAIEVLIRETLVDPLMDKMNA
jgi:hypothetical protein